MDIIDLKGELVMLENLLKFKNYAAALLLIISMLVSSIFLGQKDILFPEIAGMAVGVMVFPVAHWIKKPVHLWLSPSLAAFLGTALNGLSVSPLLKIWLCFVIIVILMHVFRVHFAPTIPAGMLPILLGMYDYMFAFTTMIFTFMIMLAAYKLNKPDKLSNGPLNFRKKADTLFISVMICLWIGLAFATHIQVIVVPPVFVLIFEVFHAEKFSWRRIPANLAVVTLTAILAVAVYHLLPGSILLAGIGNVLITFLICRSLKTPSPVAFGVSLMPFILPAWGTWWFPVGVFITAGVFMCLSAAYRQIRTRQADEPLHPSRGF